MANFCHYETHVVGSRNSSYMIYRAMPALEEQEIIYENGNDERYELHFKGVCKWSVNYGVSDEWSGSVPALDDMDIDDVLSAAEEYMGYSLRAKSEIFHCTILAHYWSEESEFDQFDQYENGNCIKKRKIAFSEDNRFDWEVTEFVGHEGEYDEAVDGEERDTEFMSAFLKATAAISSQSKTAKNQNEVPSGEDNCFVWTFKEGKTASGDGWTIGIPDSYKIRSSMEGRVFEAIPMEYENSAPGIAPACILPGTRNPQQNIQGEHWLFHPDAKAAISEIVTVSTSKVMTQMLGGSVSDVLSAGWSDICAGVIVQDTGISSYSYQCTIYTDGFGQQMRVQTGNITDEQKELLSKSVVSWLKTFRFSKPNPAAPKIPLIEKESCLSSLKRGSVKEFEKAVDQAQSEYSVCINGKIGTIKYLAENGMLSPDDSYRATEIMMTGFKVKEFYVTRIDDVLEKYRSMTPDNRVLEKIYKKLHDLVGGVTEINFGHRERTVEIPEQIQEITNKWKREEKQVKKDLAEERKVQEEERKRRRKEEKEKQRRFEEEKKRIAEQEEEEKRRISENRRAEQYDSINEKLAGIESIIKQKEEKIKSLQAERNSLGLFKGKEKKRINDEITRIENELKSENEKRNSLSKQFAYFSALPGETITFGKDINSNGKEDLNWIVLDNSENMLLLVCTEIMEFMVFQDAINWVSSFKNSAFSSDEKKMLVPLSGGPMSGKEVFFLSPEEEDKYRAGTTHKAQLNKYIKDRIIKNAHDDRKKHKYKEEIALKQISKDLDHASDYWLRCEPRKEMIGSYKNTVVDIYWDDPQRTKEHDQQFPHIASGVRPAIRISIC